VKKQKQKLSWKWEKCQAPKPPLVRLW